MGAVHNDLHSWAAKARGQGRSTIEIDLETADRASEKIVELSNRVMDLEHALRARTSEPEAGEPAAVTIFCPECALPHIDEGEWATTRQDKTHQCQGCGHEWRPFPFATVGVTHPAPASADKLRVAVEALEPFAMAAKRLRPDDPASDRPAFATAAQYRAAAQAFATLSPKEEGGE